ncbi:zinc-dependent alcohol dehydrogenase family protein [Allokutzneria oryzae]|uniref:Zinc-dependent alcohol dehydrogenase family protein n=1 Tax=Allokutzneria oryzae TaxID=1378989 RepID=A0ABV5ZVR9_9PSEU
MLATTLHGPGDIRVEQVPDPVITAPTDAVVTVTHACICGSDLWPYQGVSPSKPGARIGHEFLGRVAEVGAGVTTLRPGDLVVAPFMFSDGECVYCREQLPTSCVNGGMWGKANDGGQGEALRVPFADATLVKLPADADEALMPALLSLSDVLPTGHHAASIAGVRPGATVAVVGDGAVGLCGVLAARRLGAERIIAMGRHEARTAIARAFGATDVVAARGEEAVAAVAELTGGEGAHAVIEAVGTAQSMQTAISITRPGGGIGYVGVPHVGGEGLDINRLFTRNIALRGGVAPARSYIEELLPDVLSRAIDPSPIFDSTMKLSQVAEGYAAMNERRALKVLITP